MKHVCDGLPLRSTICDEAVIGEVPFSNDGIGELAVEESRVLLLDKQDTRECVLLKPRTVSACHKDA